MIFATSQDAQQLDPVSSFFAQYGMLLLLLALIVFMFWSSRRRSARMKAEQENKQRAMVPGVKVLLQGGLYGTLVEFDAEDLSRPAIIALAPGVEIEVHSQAIIRVVDEEPGVTEDELVESEEEAAEYAADVEPGVISPADADAKPDADDKPRA
jgi:preprotein translocase subunit YajC